ncbi:MAG TPA: VWA domain-containing protein [Vicinamibacterales bacterium]|nr:VWA domain-containing protein [Vicinamibacterales bacterium]
MHARFPVVAGLVSVLVAAGSAQAPQDRPVFRSGVRLVRLDVRVVDASGRPITDLRADEIRILEGGVRRPVVLFQRVAGLSPSYIESAQRTIASDVSTNQGAPQGQLFVLVFDQDHIRSGGEQPVRLAADAFLRTQVRPHDRVAMYGLPGPGPTQPFTANLASARQQLDLLRGGLDRRANGAVTEMTLAEAYEIVRGNELVLSRFITVAFAAPDRVQRDSEDPAVVRRLLRENAQSIVNRADAEARRFLVMFADVLRGLRGIDGRKTVLLFSEGFYGDNVARDLEDVATAAAETYSVIYSFDLNRRTDLTAAESSTSDEPTEILNRLEPLGSLAAETSGALVKDASVRLQSAMSTLLSDDGSYYLVGFEPASPETGDSHYRRVKLDVARPDARAISRTGYAIGAQPTPADRRRAIDAALGAPFTQQGLKLEYTTYVGQASVPGMQRVAVSLLAELPVRLDRPAGTDADASSADIVFVVRDSRTGRVAASGTEALALPVRTDRGSSTGNSPWHVAFELPAGDYIMRCVVREPGGIVGSADRRFSVRALGGFDIGASDLVLTSPGDSFPVRARAYTEGTLTGTARLYGRTADQLQPVTARLELVPIADAGDRQVSGRGIAATFGQVIVTPTGAMRDVMFALPLSGLDAGPYVARAVVQAAGEVVADLRRPVDVVVGAAPEVARTDESRPSDVLHGEIGRRLVRDLASSARDEVRGAAASLGRGQWTGAINALASAPETDVDANRVRGLAHLGARDYRSAAASLGLAFDARPVDAALAFVLGWARIGAGDATGAISAFRNAAHLEPTMVPAYLALAGAYVNLAQPALAVQALESGLRHLPDSRELQTMLAALKR